MSKDYKKLYEEALEIARDLHNNHALGQPQTWITCEKIFPELKESEDERIRKAIIYGMNNLKNQNIKTFATIPIDDCLAWLEKQGGKVDVLDDFPTEFERQISHLIASSINKEWEYKKDFVKHTANALLQYAKNELEKQGEQKSWSEEDESMLLMCLDAIAAAYAAGYYTFEEKNKMQNWLKLLKTNHWKPSEQNIKDLEWCADLVKDKMGVGFHRLQVFIDELKSL